MHFGITTDCFPVFDLLKSHPVKMLFLLSVSLLFCVVRLGTTTRNKSLAAANLSAYAEQKCNNANIRLELDKSHCRQTIAQVLRVGGAPQKQFPRPLFVAHIIISLHGARRRNAHV